MRQALMITAALATVGCSSSVETDDRPAFQIDPTLAYQLELGRESGLAGLDTVRVSQNGSVVLHRLQQGQQEHLWETSTLQLPPDPRAKILKAVEVNGLMELHRTYHNPKIADGTQWVLWIKQGEQEKAIYCNNSFPPQITRFANQLDGILSAAGLDKLVWQPVPANKWRQHERELWDSIKR
jgi:hypothetical protein